MHVATSSPKLQQITRTPTTGTVLVTAQLHTWSDGHTYAVVTAGPHGIANRYAPPTLELMRDMAEELASSHGYARDERADTDGWAASWKLTKL